MFGLFGWTINVPISKHLSAKSQTSIIDIFYLQLSMQGCSQVVSKCQGSYVLNPRTLYERYTNFIEYIIANSVLPRWLSTTIDPRISILGRDSTSPRSKAGSTRRRKSIDHWSYRPHPVAVSRQSSHNCRTISVGVASCRTASSNKFKQWHQNHKHASQWSPQ